MMRRIPRPLAGLLALLFHLAPGAATTRAQDAAAPEPWLGPYTGPTRADVLRLAAHLGIGDNGAQQFLFEVAAKPGALRNVTNVVKQARMQSEGARLTAAALRDAASLIGL